MDFLTARKRAEGLGSAKEGTEHFWHMTVSSLALLFLVPAFVLTFAPMLGEPHAEVVAHFARPWPALVTILMLAVGFVHFKNGARVAIEDYTGGLTRKLLIVAATAISYAAAATGIYAVARMAL